MALIEEGDERMNPASECLHSSVLSLSILTFAESEIPIDESKVLEGLRTDLLRVNPYFSSIIIKDKNGDQWWKKVETRVEDHVKTPFFPVGLSPESYDEIFKNYLSKIGLEEFPRNQPPWEVFIFKYPRPGSEGTMVFKLHHAIGDGFSIMGTVFSCFRRADDPSLSLTFPSTKSSSLRDVRERNVCKRVVTYVCGIWYTITDFAWSLMYSTLLEDSCSAVRSGSDGIELKPIDVSWVTFSLDEIRKIKFTVGGTVNDVLVGLLCYGVHLYSKEVGRNGSNSRQTALVLLNLRMVKGYRNLEDMHKNDMWGNNFSFIHVPLPKSNTDKEDEEDPLTFVFKAKDIINRKNRSMDVFLNAFFLRMLATFKGAQVMSKHVYTTLRNSTMTISNLAGPTEKMQIVDHPINGIYFTVTRVPQSLVFTMLSYNGQVNLMVTSEKGFINSQLLVSCLNESFKKIFEAASNKDAMKNN